MAKVFCLDLMTGKISEYRTINEFQLKVFGTSNGTSDKAISEGKPQLSNALWAWKEGTEPPLHEQEIAVEFVQTLSASGRLPWKVTRRLF